MTLLRMVGNHYKDGCKVPLAQNVSFWTKKLILIQGRICHFTSVSGSDGLDYGHRLRKDEDIVCENH